MLAPVGFDADGNHDGLIWTGESELPRGARALADWLQEEGARPLG
ncbi:hypothetical protein AB4099_26960 [Bosea sp. 2KB_26]